MCEYGTLGSDYSAATQLAKLLARELDMGAISAENVRNLIRNHWSKLAALAHKIHEEEESQAALRRAAKNISALSEDGILGIVAGRAYASPELRADFRKIADALK